MRASDVTRKTAAFTLVELIVVMALLGIAMALSAPLLSRSMRERHLADEAVRFLAATEYARDEAISQGVPMRLWIDTEAGRFGVEPKTGFPGDAGRSRDFEVNQDVHLEVSATVQDHGIAEGIEFAPDGIPEPTSVESVQLIDRFGSAMTVARNADGLGYEIQKAAK